MISELKLMPNLKPEDRLDCSVDWLLTSDLGWESVQAAKWLLALFVGSCEEASSSSTSGICDSLELLPLQWYVEIHVKERDEKKIIHLLWQ